MLVQPLQEPPSPFLFGKHEKFSDINIVPLAVLLLPHLFQNDATFIHRK